MEILVVLAVLGLALGMVTSFGMPKSGRLSLRAAVDQLAGGLREARTMAIAGNHPVFVAIDVTNGRWQIEGRPPTDLPPGIALSLLTVSGETTGDQIGRFRFFPDGSASGGRIDLVGMHRRMAIGIDWLTGRITTTEKP